MSADGRFIALRIIPDIHLTGDNLYVIDTLKGTTTLVTASMSGAPSSNASSYLCAISRDSRTLIFTSSSDELVPHDTNGFTDIFSFNLSRPSGNYDGDGRTDAAVFASGQLRRLLCF